MSDCYPNGEPHRRVLCRLRRAALRVSPDPPQGGRHSYERGYRCMNARQKVCRALDFRGARRGALLRHL